MKRTNQPKRRRRLRKHGFLGLMRSNGGQNRISRRRAKGRKQLTVAKK